MDRQPIHGWRGARIAAAGALGLALVWGALATAQGRLNGRDLIPGSVLRSALQQNAVGSAQIADGAVGRAELRANAVGAASIAPGAVGAEEIRDGAVGTAEIADGSVRAEDLAPRTAAPRFRVRTRRVSVPTGPALTTTVACRTGETAASGGYAGVPVGNARVLINRPQPASEDAIPLGWTVTVRNATNGPIDVVVYAVCAG